MYYRAVIFVKTKLLFMKHVFVSLLAAIFIAPVAFGQNEDETRGTDICVAFNLYDFETARLIRTTTLSAVLRDKQFGNLKDMSTGIGVKFFIGLKK